eukprot:m.160343 g.160343  ORF g.160343 m.160343 type:complete len:207 (-) comp11932_c0_seq1:161-781(-)
MTLTPQNEAVQGRKREQLQTFDDLKVLTFPRARGVESKMLIPKKTRQEIYTALFKDGVIVAKKDFNAPKHSELEVPNLMVIKAMQSLKSRGYVHEQFAWRHFYWSLTNEGIEYIRDYLHLPAEVVPATLMRAPRAEGAAPPRGGPGGPGGREGGGGGGFRGGDRGDRDSYRRDGPARGFGEKKVGAGENYQPEYRGGAGRGRAAPQ